MKVIHGFTKIRKFFALAVTVEIKTKMNTVWNYDSDDESYDSNDEEEEYMSQTGRRFGHVEDFYTKRWVPRYSKEAFFTMGPFHPSEDGWRLQFFLNSHPKISRKLFKAFEKDPKKGIKLIKKAMLESKIQKIEKSKGNVCNICLTSNSHYKMADCNCNAVYHKKCILAWLKTNETCPLCRYTNKNDDNFDTSSWLGPLPILE